MVIVGYVDICGWFLDRADPSFRELTELATRRPFFVGIWRRHQISPNDGLSKLTAGILGTTHLTVHHHGQSMITKKNGLKHAKTSIYEFLWNRAALTWDGGATKYWNSSVRLKHQGSQNLQLICEQIPWISRRFCNQHNSDVWSNSRIYRCESRVDDVRIYSNPTKAWLSVTEIRHDSIAHHGDSTNTRPYLAVQLGWVHWNCTKKTIEDCWFTKN